MPRLRLGLAPLGQSRGRSARRRTAAPPPPSRRTELLAVGALVWAAALFGTSFVVVKDALDLIGPIYDAAADPDPARWPAFLEQLGGVFKSAAGILYFYDMKNS